MSESQTVRMFDYFSMFGMINDLINYINAKANNNDVFKHLPKYNQPDFSLN